MTDLLLNACGDVDVTEGRLSLIKDADAVKQRWLIYIRTFLGEWFLDQNLGVPYVQRLFEKQISRQTIKQVLTAATLEVPGILQVTSVIVDSLDVRARTMEVTISAVIDGAEGPETGQLQYSGTLPDGGCDSATPQPATVPGLLAWFDASDPGSYSYDPGTFLRLQNKAGAGFADLVSSITLTGLVGVSPIGGLPAIRLANRGGNAEHIEISGIPAIRAATGKDGAFTVLHVAALRDDIVPAGSTESLWSLDGVLDDGVTREWYSAFQVLSTVPFQPTGDGGLGIKREAIGGPQPAPYERLDSKTPTITDGAGTVRAWRRGPRVEAPRTRALAQNGAGYGAPDDGAKPGETALSGSGLIGAVYDSGTGLPSARFDGYFGEWLLYDRFLTDMELSSVFGYLLSKWNLPESA